ncbi:ParB/RepB/Spo0J family partition protein [Brevibacterium sp. 2SA]|uniref:ParB/RepB/Spo0J family partition protein n=1 Tax=Brevibacterium sp. 2SA TaxID=2502198 RepID=UPI002016CBE8|nr:ParB/RepB/Spo0J family partition protein [Brevibacterium sp. 2SA]
MNKRTAVKPSPAPDSTTDDSIVVDEQTTASSVAASDAARSLGSSASVDEVEMVDDVREQHPGVYTSKGGSLDDDRSAADDSAAAGEPADDSDKQSPKPATIDVVESPDDTSANGDSEFDDGPGVDSIPDTAFGEVDVELIDPNPRQPRTVFDEDQLAELVHSIREIGVLQPVVVRRKPGAEERYELIMGERRLRATKEAGLGTIPAIVRFVDDTDLLRDALLENLHRAELNPLEEAAAYGQLLEDFNCTQEELSERIGRSRPQISNTLRLLRLPPLVQRRVAAGVISAGHARAILGLKDPEQMEVLAQRIVAEGLSVRASEEAVVLLNRGDSVNVSRATSRVAPEFIEVAERLGDRLDTKVNITVGKRKGKLSVEFANQEDLDRILSLLGVKSAE